MSGDSLLMAYWAKSSICFSGGYDTGWLSLSNSISKHGVSWSGLEPKNKTNHL